jgi:hypothetical protein
LANLPRFKWADHALLAHAADPVVRFNSHGRIVKPSPLAAHEFKRDFG